MNDIPANIAKVRLRIQQAAAQNGRPANGVMLLAVSKTRPASDIAEAYYQANQAHFGENYVQEAAAKMPALAHLPLYWHFIGPLQANKTRLIAEQFHWLHSLDRIKVAARLQDQRPLHLPPLNTCIQVNIDNETSKSGLLPAELPALVAAIAGMDRLAIRGLMVIPSPEQHPDITLHSFRQAAKLLVTLKQQFPHLPLDTLSMGMSADLELAIAAGSTIVRVGTDLFGPRKLPMITDNTP